MHRRPNLLMNWKSGLILSCVCAMALGAGPLRQTQIADVIEVVPIELEIDWSAADGATALQAAQPIEMTEAMILAETAQHEIGIALKKGRVSVLVHFEQTFARGAANPRVAVRALAVQRLGVVKYEYGAVLPNVINLRNMPVSAIAELENMPGVLRVEMDEYHPNLVRLHDATSLVNGLQSQITAAGLSADGAGIRVCIADTGIDIDHVMYASRIDSGAGFDFSNNDSNPDDDNGHGSHVAGIAVGAAGLNVDFGCGSGAQAFQGMAPQATLIGVKILNSAGGGFDSDIIAGINHCADQSASGGRADVINLSIGTGNFTSGSCTHSWAVASNNAVANGVVVVAASGNENRSNSMGSPACGVNVIAVGAVYKANYPTCEDNTTNWNWGSCTDNSPNQDQIVCFSNESDFLDVSAPGANIWSASNAAGGGSIAGKSGTSMASPMVAGLAALILSADPSLTPAEVRQIIRDGAVDLGPAGFDRAYGFGRIDAIGSLALVSGGGCSIDADCDDGVFCNGAETCVATVCQSGTAVNCNDGVGCTDDSCNEGTNSCDNIANDGNCGDGLFCNGVETCNASLDCQAGSAVNCNDGIGCTSDSCNEGTNSCDNTTNNAACDDGVFCNGSETCSATLDCQAGAAVNCNDGVGCTDDSCNEGTNSCNNIVNNANCDNGLFCDGNETCSATLDCQAGTAVNCNDGVGCTDDSCNEGTNSCDNVANNANCDNGLFCDGNETCSATLDCQAGTAVNCNDGVGCTDDSCNEGTNSCDNVANNANCDNGLFCDGAETCSATLDCQVGTAVNCNDGVGCTDDSCNEGTNSCDNITNNANCDDGLFCNGAETCDAALDCQTGSDPCAGLSCDEATNTCAGCLIDADCDDNVFCNGVETCVAGTCQSGGAVNCNDGVGCTTDSCNEANNSCDNIANNAACDDGLFCNGSETCSATLDCQAGTAVDCNDGVGCTADSCNEGTNSCDNTANNAACDDGVFCNGSELCDVSLDCQLGSDPCPGQTCDEGTQTCSAGGCSINADCDDGNACTTDICSGSVCSNDCPSSVSSFPYSENFDAGLGQWTNVTGDVFDWTRRSGSTPSSNTGPSGDHTTGSGFYMYTETSSPRTSGDTAVLEGPCFDLSGASSATLTFWYNMFGSTMGTLEVEVSTDCTAWTNVFTLSGDQGNTWFESTIDLTPEAGSSSVNVRFRGIRGSSWRGDIAVDDIGVTMVASANCLISADCDDGNACTDDACIASVCQNTNNTSVCDDGLFCNGADVCQSGVCTPVTNPGVTNGTFDGSGSWTSNLSGGSITYPANLNVVGADAGSAAFTWASQGGVTFNGANVEFDLNSYSSGDTGGWDYPVFHVDGTFYGLNLNGTLGAATTGGNGNGGTVDNAGQVASPIHYIVNVDALTGNGGLHTIGFGVHTVDGGFGAGTAVFDTVLPAGGAIDPCPGQTCDEVGDVCIP